MHVASKKIRTSLPQFLLRGVSLIFNLLSLFGKIKVGE
jgi:hypothetical protein